MNLSVTPSPDYQFANAEKITIANLNRLAKTTFSISGTLSAAEIAAGAVTDTKTKAGAHFLAATCTFAAGTYTLTWPTGQGPAALANGLLIVFKADAANTGATNLDAGVGTAQNIFKNTGGIASDAELQANDIGAGMFVELRYDGTNFRMLSRVASQEPAPSPAGTAVDLEIYRHATTTTRLDYSWTSIVLKSDAGSYVSAGAKSGTYIDASVSGAIDRLDTGTLNSGSWYSIYAVSNGSTHGMVLTLATNSKPDAGILGTYPYYAYVSQIYCTGAGTLRPIVQRGNQVSASNKEVFKNTSVVLANTWEVLTGTPKTDFQSAVPPKAKSCSGTIGSYDANDACVGISGTKSDGTVDTGNNYGMCAVVAAKVSTALTDFTWYAAGHFTVPVRGTGGDRNIQWIAANNTTKYKLDITGYTV